MSCWAGRWIAFLMIWRRDLCQEMPQRWRRRLHPRVELMTCERYVFDLIIRHSGAAAIADIGPIAMAFGKFDAVLAQWFAQAGFRRTVDQHLLAEGVQAFAVQAMALNFCAINGTRPLEDRLRDLPHSLVGTCEPGT